MLCVWVRRGGCIGSWCENRKERVHWRDLAVDEWIILGWISRAWDVGICIYCAGPVYRQFADTCRCGNEPSSSVKCG